MDIVVAGYGEGKYTDKFELVDVRGWILGLGFGSYGNRTKKAMRTTIFLDVAIRRPQMKSMGIARMRISVITSKAVASCHRVYYELHLSRH